VSTQTERAVDRPSKAGERQGVVKKRLAAFAGTVRRMVRLRFRRAEEACRTHTPGKWCQPGSVYERDGKRWLVTELRREIDTGLIGGGRAPCWSVWGKRIDDMPNAQPHVQTGREAGGL
jgi:hypothetical protein